MHPAEQLHLEELSLPDLAGMILATIKALKAIGGSATIRELDEQAVEMEGISEEEQSLMMPNDQYRRLNYYLSWARTYLKRGGALENSSRGVWALTKHGELQSRRLLQGRSRTAAMQLR